MERADDEDALTLLEQGAIGGALGRRHRAMMRRATVAAEVGTTMWEPATRKASISGGRPRRRRKPWSSRRQGSRRRRLDVQHASRCG